MSRNIQGTQREVRKVEKMVRRMYRIIKDEKEKEENWDKFPERVQGKIDGVISMAASAFLSESKKAG